MLQLKNKKKYLLIEEEKKTGMYHVQLLKASGKVKQELDVSPDFLVEVLFGNNEEDDTEDGWQWLCVILFNLLIFFLLTGGGR